MPMRKLKPKPKNQPDLIKLNLGCGANKIPGYINIDMEKSLKPDLHLNFVYQRLPFKDGTVDEVILFHTIEHIQKRFHQKVLSEVRRVLKLGARVIITYPQFDKCYERWKSNFKGERQYWEATMFGRQAFPSDFHVCIMMPRELEQSMVAVGYDKIIHRPEPHLYGAFNTITVGHKSRGRYALL